MNNQTAEKFHPEIAEAIESAQSIGRDLKTIHTEFADGKIDQATFAKKLETIERRQAVELRALIGNLQYKVAHQVVVL